MKCEKICELLFEYVNGELEDKAAAEVEAHLAECESCKKEYELLLGIFEAVESADYEAPAELHGIIMSGIEREKKRVRRAKLIKNLTTIAASAAAFVIVVNIFLTSFPKFGDNEPGNQDKYEVNKGDASDSNGNVSMRADNIFTSDTAMGSGRIELSNLTINSFVGEWTTELEGGNSVTMKINVDRSVVVSLKYEDGNEIYYDGMLEFSANGITLSQSDGNAVFNASVQMILDGKKLFFDIIEGQTPWGKAT